MVIDGRKRNDSVAEANGACIQITGDLTRSISAIVAERRYYSAVLLGRQIIETTHLLEYFRIKPDRATFWLTATDNEIQNARDFRPLNLRTSTGNGNAAYSRHCALGGHPRSMARILLPGSHLRSKETSIDLRPFGVTWVASLHSLILTDTLQHGYEAVTAAIEALGESSLSTLGEAEGHIIQLSDELIRDLVSWRRKDHLATITPQGE